MELYIETLTGAAFELRVSPYETIMSVKAKIARLEGIPISQQHLIWQSTELDDDYCLQDYSIQDGATLKLVLAMRGGPINTRRVPMEDTELRHLSEYIASEASQDDLVEKMSGSSRGQVTLVVFRDGDQLNFFRVVDKGDGSYSPLSGSVSGGSMYNLDDDDDDLLTKERVVENDQTKEKMQLLKLKMENLTVSKKPKKKHVPRPPSGGRPGSKVRLRRLPNSGSAKSRHNLNKNPCLPPLGHSQVESTAETVQNKTDISSDLTMTKLTSSATQKQRDPLLGLHAVAETSESDLLHPKGDLLDQDCGSKSTSDKEDSSSEINATSGCEETGNSAKTESSCKEKELTKHSNTSKDGKLAGTSKKRDLSLMALKESLKSPTSPRGHRDYSLDKSNTSKNTKKEVTFETVLGHSGGKYGTHEGMREYALEGLSQSEARAVSGMLQQASIERLGSSRLSTFMRSASRSRAGFTMGSAVNNGRISTPEGRLVSARLQKLSAGHGERVMSPSHRLPPVKAKKKSKKCSLCGKKTGLATSYQCRCGNNFCATHRYAEAHSCTFDYKTEGRKLLEQTNPVISAPKLPKI